MKVYRNPILTLSIVTLLAVLVPKARADGMTEREQVTFSQPVEIPGQVLPAGNYVFEMLDPISHLTRILGADERHVYATLFTIPEERMQPAEKATVILEESLKGAPERIESWFYPGDSIGSSFIYKHRGG